MASLRETKDRINSVKGTLKITTAMKFVASSKLHKAQNAIDAMVPYHKVISEILHSLKNAGTGLEANPDGKVAIVAIASNTSLCGSFNANALRLAMTQLGKYPDADVYAIGRKMSEPLAKAGHPSVEDFTKLIARPDYEQAAGLADKLCDKFIKGEYSEVILVYNHFVNFVKQHPMVETFLPYNLSIGGSSDEEEIILEPGAEEIARILLPKMLRLKIYTTLLDSSAAENAARTIAMQTASENAEKLLSELTLEYNKGRQQKITNEILDLIGGAQK